MKKLMEPSEESWSRTKLRDYPECSDWRELPVKDQDWAKSLAGNFHYRDGVTFEDGSVGNTAITHKQLLDVIVIAMNHDI